MALIPDEPRDQYRLLGILVLLGAGVLFWLYVYSPRQAELVVEEDRLATLESFNRQAAGNAGELDELRVEVEGYRRQLEALRRLIPARSRTADLYERLATESERHGVELISVIPSPARPDSAGLMRRSWDMEVRGRYHSVGQFLTELASMDRIVQPAVEQMVPAAEASGGEDVPMLQVDLTIQTYVLQPDSLAGEGGAAPGASGP